MASVVLSGTPATLAVVADDFPNPIVAQGTNGGRFVAQRDGTFPGYYTADLGLGSAGGLDAYVINGGAVPGTVRWGIGTTSVEAGANSGNDLSIYRYADGAGNLGSALNISRATGLVGMQTGFAATQAGIANIPQGATTVNVANAAVTANAVITCTPTGAVDGVADYVKGVAITPGVGFIITVNGAVANLAGWNIAYFIARF